MTGYSTVLRSVALVTLVPFLMSTSAIPASPLPSNPMSVVSTTGGDALNSISELPCYFVVSHQERSRLDCYPNYLSLRRDSPTQFSLRRQFSGASSPDEFTVLENDRWRGAMIVMAKIKFIADFCQRSGCLDLPDRYLRALKIAAAPKEDRWYGDIFTEHEIFGRQPFRAKMIFVDNSFGGVGIIVPLSRIEEMGGRYVHISFVSLGTDE